MPSFAASQAKTHRPPPSQSITIRRGVLFSPRPEMSVIRRARPVNLLSPSPAPSDARQRPFSDIARSCQTKTPSELVQCTQLQSREIAATVRNPQRCDCYLLSVGFDVVKTTAAYPERECRGLIVQANRSPLAAPIVPRSQVYLADEINKSSRLSKISDDPLMQL